MNKEFYYRLDIVLNAITRKGKELAKTEEELQEWLKDYLIVITEIEKYCLDLKDIWEDPTADEALKELERIEALDDLKEIENALSELRNKLAAVYNRYLEKAMKKKK
jgi:hypothetical protein